MNIRLRERLHSFAGHVYLIRDVVVGGRARCFYATRDPDDAFQALEWTECAEGVEFKDIRPLISASEIMLESATGGTDLTVVEYAREVEAE